jgi:hypothetical protein
MMLVMLHSRMRALLQHITKIHQGSANNVLGLLSLLVELCNTRGSRLHFIRQDFLKLLYAEVSLLNPQYFCIV